MSDTASRVKRIISEHLGHEPGELNDASTLFDDLGADSLDTVELTMAFEEEFGIEIPDEDMEAVKTVGDCIALVNRLTA